MEKMANTGVSQTSISKKQVRWKLANNRKKRILTTRQFQTDKVAGKLLWTAYGFKILAEKMNKA